MVKFITIKNYLRRITLSIIGIVAISNFTYGLNNVHSVVIIGQVLNMECGKPIDGHVIHIESDTTKDGLSGYSKTLLTNSEGYYYDTIVTTEEKGSFVIYTYDYNDRVFDTTVHFRFMDRESSIIIVNFALYLPYQYDKLQAIFKFVQKQNGDRNKFKFIDQTKNDNIIEWDWDFGDGTISNLRNPEHIFQTYGLFKISLTVSTMVDDELQTSEVSKYLYISEKEYYHLGGHVFSEYFPIDMGSAYLYSIDSLSNYTPVDTVKFDTLGYYFFYQIPKGRYIVKVEPLCESQYYGELLPTYYGDCLFWEESKTIDLNSTCWEYDVKLVHAIGNIYGNGKIAGNVIYDDLPLRYSGLSAGGINIYLFDDSDNLLTCHYSDNSGNFSFDFIELNTYWLYPEITGLHVERVKVELTPEIPTIDNIEIIILTNGVSFIVPDGENTLDDIVGFPYPNPATDRLYIPLNTSTSSISYEIYNMFGQLLSSSSTSQINGKYHISLNSINNGSYLLRTIVDNKTYDRGIIVAR